MTKKVSDTKNNETVAVHLPKVLFDRVRVYCEERNITIDEFMLDAVGEQLQRSYKEKRRRPRL